VDQLLAGRGGRTHDHANLYVAGGGAMPSASIINSLLSKFAADRADLGTRTSAVPTEEVGCGVEYGWCDLPVLGGPG
jgi:hypothetical protein